MRPFARRRSCLTVPGGSEKMLRKAASLGADEIVLDLEDGMAPDAKDAARRMVVEALRGGTFAGRLVAVRINGIGTPWHDADVAALARLKHDGLSMVLPKAASGDDIKRVASTTGLEVQALIETAAGLARCQEIAAASPSLVSLIIGYGDLASSLGRSESAGWDFAQEAVLLVARVNGLQAIDGPCFDLNAGSTRLKDEAALTAAKGFDGKWAIHPSQIETINVAFTPGEDAVRRARGIIAALDAAQGGVAMFGGEMIDEAMRGGSLRALDNVEGTK
jgi:citrate lyase subunit beta/citryl-CoA lyase